MTDYIELENLPVTANHLLNVLWSRNCEMDLTELLWLVNTSYCTAWGKKDIEYFLQLLIEEDYIAIKRHGLKIFYFALGTDGGH